MTTSIPLIENGFIPVYVVSGPIARPYVPTIGDKNQLSFEKRLRHLVVDHDVAYETNRTGKNRVSRLGTPWNVWYSHNNGFVSCPTTSSGLDHVQMDAYTILNVSEQCSLKIRLWSYMALILFVNGERKAEIVDPVYKPMSWVDVVIPLQAGDNEFYCIGQNLGVRDTRNIFGIQVLSSPPHVAVCLPGFEQELSIKNWLDGISLERNHLVFPFPAPEKTVVGMDSEAKDLAEATHRYRWVEVSGSMDYLCDGTESKIIVRVKKGEEYFQRVFEIFSRIVPRYVATLTSKGNYLRYLEEVAKIRSEKRNAGYGFAIAHILARKFLQKPLETDAEDLGKDIDLIGQKIDCSDFLLAGLLRYMKNYSLPPHLFERAKKVIFDYRYWMQMKGMDSMCFWSENHSLLFYSSAYIAGSLFPDEFFLRAEMKGKDLARFGYRMLGEWLDDVSSNGSEEFLSPTYLCLTVAGLLNVVDYGDAVLSQKASKLLDKLFDQLALHTFDGCLIGPMGRVYRDVLSPCRQAVQTLLNIANPAVPATSQQWFSFYATSTYRIQKRVAENMNTPVKMRYTEGNALIAIHKTQAYCLTSVQCPRTDHFYRWRNITMDSSSRFLACHAYTKSLNERYHGTTDFCPGIYGYQQHLFDVALSSTAHVFANHPGVFNDSTSNRPGYWYGDGIMPMVCQVEDRIGVIYDIPPSHPIHFTHVYFPEEAFDEVNVDNTSHFIFARKEHGYLAVWHSAELTDYNDELFHVEKRCYASRVAYVFIVSSDEKESFDDFKKRIRGDNIHFDLSSLSLYGGPEFEMRYVAMQDSTQYV